VNVLDMLVDRLFGPDQHRPITHGFAAIPSPSLESSWSCEYRGHLLVPGDEGCVYCSEVD
jgi:hypothetical protein